MNYLMVRYLLTFSGFLILAGTISLSSSAQNAITPFDTTQWDLSGARQTEFLGRRCISGTAYLRESQPANGVIAFDMAVTGDRSYPGVLFHQSAPGDFERVYIRPHLPSFFQNVIQYVSTYNDLDSWQLYSGPGNTAAADIPRNHWVHVTIEISGVQARIFLEDDSLPALAIPHLGHGSRPGRIGLSGPAEGSAFFSNFSFTPANNLSFPPETVRETPYGIIEKWQISQPFKQSDVDNEVYPEAQGLTGIKWQEAHCRPDGIVDISRYTGRTTRLPETIFAKTTLESTSGETKLLSFGYSDIISVFLNGNLLFCGNSGYTSRDPLFQGIVGLNDYISLPLKKGRNELMIALTESYGGWGFIFQDARAVYTDSKLVKRWEIKTGLCLPESVAYDTKRDVLYVSNYFNDGKECITKFSTDGTVIQRDWATGVAQPTGLCMNGGKLYAVCRYALVEIDPDSGIVTNRFRFPEPGMPNDVTADEQGTFYITDSQKNQLYRLKDGNMEVWMQGGEITKPNGILANAGKIMVGTSGDGCLKIIDPETKNVSTLACFGDGSVMDGIATDGKGNYLVSDYNGRIFRVTGGGSKELLLNTTATGQPGAAIEYIPEKHLLVIPTFVNNKVIGYELIH